MEHCAEAFERAGVMNGAHLAGIGHWGKEGIKNFLKNNDIAHSAMEIEAIVIGLTVSIVHFIYLLKGLYIN